MTLSIHTIALALSVLESFQDNSAYEDYKDSDGWTDGQYAAMLSELRSAVQAQKQDDCFVFEHKGIIKVPHIGAETAALCVALGEPIIIKARWEADRWGHGTYWMRIESDIYNAVENKVLTDEQVAAFNYYQSLQVDNETRYDGDYNWTDLGSDAEQAEEILQLYLDAQKARYPECVFEMD